MRKLGKDSIFRDILTLFTGTAIAQIIPVAIQPVLRRLYTPEDFGHFAIYISISSTLIIIATLRYEMAILLPKRDVEAMNILALSMIISLSFSLILVTAILFFQDFFLSILKMPDSFRGFLYLIPASVFLFSSYQSFNYWLIRKKAFKKSSINKIIRRSIEAMTQLFLGIVPIKIGLLIGDIVGRIALQTTSIYQALRSEFQFHNVSYSKIVKEAKEHKEFPIYNAFPALLNTSSIMIPLLLINYFYSSQFTGQVDLCMQLLGLPLALISASVSQVLFQRVSELINKKESVAATVNKIIKVLLLLAGAGVLIIELFGRWGVNFIFGVRWDFAGIFIMILVISYAIRFVVSPLSIILTAFKKLKILAIWQVSYFLCISSLYFLHNIAIGFFLAIYVAIDIITYSIYLFLIYNEIIRYEKDIRDYA